MAKQKRTLLNAENQLVKLGERLKSLRKKAGFTSAETFSNEHDLNRAMYGLYEQGKKDLQFSTLIKLINCHHMSLKEFFSEGFD